jgi:hypothetical protein
MTRINEFTEEEDAGSGTVLHAYRALNGVVPFQGKCVFGIVFPGRVPWAKEWLRRWCVARAHFILGGNYR